MKPAVFFLVGLVSSFNLTCNNNLVMYWGQNSYGGAHPSQPELWEKDLEHYCRSDDVDVIAVSFLNVFNAGTGQFPEINFANHCETMFDSPLAPKLRNCPKIGADIKFCQSRGKTILLSLGGAIGNTAIPSKAAATEFADTLWNMFMGGSHQFRPFGDAIVDGIDLDLEGGSQDNYFDFLTSLQSHYQSSSRTYFVTAAPQCDFPDRNLQNIMEHSHIDAIFIQFYNNWCGVHNYDNPFAWNWPTWATWAKTKSFNPDMKLFLGVPASSTAAGSGYVDIDRLWIIASALRRSYAAFGGVMLWDVSQSENNRIQGKTFSQNTKDRLLAGGDCKPDPPPITTTTTTTTATKTTTTTTTATTTYTSTTPTSTYTSTITTTTTTTSPPSPQPTNQCPVTGQPCTGGTACSGDQFAVCNFGHWVVYPCGEGTVCSVSNNSAYCDFPGLNPPPPCIPTQQHKLSLGSTYHSVEL